MAIPKTEAKRKKETKSLNTHASHGQITGGEHGKLPPHDGPPKEPDTANITAEKAEPTAIGRTPRSGLKPITDSDRIAALERRLDSLGRQLRTHGIHIPHKAAAETIEE